MTEAQTPVLTGIGDAIVTESLQKWFSSESGTYTAVEDINLQIPKGAFVSLVGPSGCGKSTILNIVAGLTKPSAGAVRIFGEELTGLNKRASYMFQQDALLPWKTVEENIALGLQFRRQPYREALAAANNWIRRVGLDGFGGRFPYQLSGGMRKRVAMAQCWIVDPDIVLMDEPFGALDVHTRHRMEGEILDLWAESRKTVLFITHDLEEAIALSDQVVVLSSGPASRVVARHDVDLLRPRNLLDLKMDPRFTELYRIIWSDLRKEVLRSYERNRE